MSNNELAKPAISASRRWRRRLTVPAAMAVGLTGVLAALPAAQAGAATALTKVTKNTGTIPTAGSPKVAATAKIAVIASAVDPANGDVAESNGNQVFLVVNATAEPATDFGIGTSGTLTKGDAYLLAGKGGAGWPTPLVDGTKAVTSDIGIPSLVSFDGNGNLVMAGKSTGRTYVSTVPATTGSYYGFTSMTAGGLYFLAGNSVPGKTVPAPGHHVADRPYTRLDQRWWRPRHRWRPERGAGHDNSAVLPELHHVEPDAVRRHRGRLGTAPSWPVAARPRAIRARRRRQ